MEIIECEVVDISMTLPAEQVTTVSLSALRWAARNPGRTLTVLG